MLIRYCPQRVDELTPAIRVFASGCDGHTLGLFGRLQLSSAGLERWDSLSPGERKRWQVAAALAESPELLLLDEPTNHLDDDARRLLFDALCRYRGIGVLVSHDRDLLDALTQTTIRIVAPGDVTQYSGNYTAARDRWRNEEERTKAAREKLRAEQRKLKRRLDDARRSRAKAESDKSAATRLKGIRDSDARSMAAKGRVAKAEQSLGRSVSVLRDKLDRVEKTVVSTRVEKEKGRSVFVLEEPAPKRDLIWLERETLGVAARVLLRDLRVTIRRDSRIRLMGPNGSGKTTLIQELLRESRLPKDRVLYLPQEQTGRQAESILREVELLPGDVKGRLLQIVAALGVTPERLMASDRPSPGEARKLRLAIGLSKQAWLLLLDEPTNHLDLPSVERLEEALADYSGALLLVSHEDRFADALTDERWTIAEQRLAFA
jgi:ATPase subunit of ABC transporter with duplicated ATPase domains